jgi:hypothetical protein
MPVLDTSSLALTQSTLTKGYTVASLSKYTNTPHCPFNRRERIILNYMNKSKYNYCIFPSSKHIKNGKKLMKKKTHSECSKEKPFETSAIAWIRIKVRERWGERANVHVKLSG